VQRADGSDTLFNTSGTNLVFESQFLRLRTTLPVDPYIYGLGEDSDVPRRGTDGFRRTLWSRDAGGVVPGTNLYGNHPVYFENRPDAGKTHGVFFKNSNGMDIWINKTTDGGQFMEFDTLGGVVDLYFLAGPGPVQVAQQYSEVIGKPAMQSYWHFGFHQCKYGYPDVMWVAEVVLNYTRAGIPLETMWSDIDYMDGRAVFTLDPDRYPKKMVQELVSYLHDHDQHYVMMVDPAVHRADYPPYNRGIEADAFIKHANGTVYEGEPAIIVSTQTY
jgi:alpha-glucosidase